MSILTEIWIFEVGGLKIWWGAGKVHRLLGQNVGTVCTDDRILTDSLSKPQYATTFDILAVCHKSLNAHLQELA